jgi:glycosyltransferase involved in cell wall biosynthesis
MSFVRAAAVLPRDRWDQFCFVVVGNGELRDEVVAEIHRHGLDDGVRWLPFAGDVRSYLDAFDVFVLPSLWESLPIAILEAMMHGKPVVASAVSGIPEAVQDGVNGRLIPPGEPEILAAVLDEVLADNEALDRMGAASRRIAVKRFALDSMLRGVAGVYDAVAE